MGQTYQCGRCWLVGLLEAYVKLPFPIYHLSRVQHYRRSRTGSLHTLSVSRLQFSSWTWPSPSLPKDVIKSRIQLRTTPPKGTPVQYIASELKAVVVESGV